MSECFKRKHRYTTQRKTFKLLADVPSTKGKRLIVQVKSAVRCRYHWGMRKV